MGAGGGEASRSTGGPTGEKGKTIKAGEGGRETSTSGEKAVAVALMKAASERREDEDQRGASWSTEEMSERWRARAKALAEERKMAWQNVSGSSAHRRQSRESSALNQEGWAAW